MGESTDSERTKDLLQALATVVDPELGLNIVDLGMVPSATWCQGDIEIAITPTSPSCPLTQLLIQEAEDALRRRFPDAKSIRIELVWSRPWSMDRLSDTARRQLGLPPDKSS